jgi:hypothetical protein
MNRQTHYKSDIKLGERYRDEQTGFEGVATSIYFFQHACERVNIETYDPERREVKEQVFDAPRLTHVASGQRASTTRTGGPARLNEGARPGPR